MDRVLSNLHDKLCHFALRNSSRQSRSLTDGVLLTSSVCALAAVILLHISFVLHHDHHLPTVFPWKSSFSRDRSKSIPLQCLSKVPGFSRDVDITHLTLLEHNYRDLVGQQQQHQQSSFSFPKNQQISHVNSTTMRARTFDHLTDSVTACEAMDWGTSAGIYNAVDNDDDSRYYVPNCFAFERSDIYFSYSKTKAYLLLPPDLCARHNISVQYVMISKSDSHCFGESAFLQHLVLDLVGTDTVMMNWLLGAFDSTGYLYNPRNKVLLDLHQHQDTGRPRDQQLIQNQHQLHMRQVTDRLLAKISMVFKTTVLFFVCTTLVSFTLRETQERMLHFTQQLQVHVRQRLPVVSIVMTHIIENLVFIPIMVGMIFFLIEFYHGDKILAFVILSIVWVCQAFAVIILQTSQSVHFYPRIFFLLFCVFHFYYFSFPFGFTYMALFATTSALLLSMSFLWNRFELAAVHENRRYADGMSAESPSTPSRPPAPGQLATTPPRRNFASMQSTDATDQQQSEHGQLARQQRAQTPSLETEGLPPLHASSRGIVSALRQTTSEHNTLRYRGSGAGAEGVSTPSRSSSTQSMRGGGGGSIEGNESPCSVRLWNGEAIMMRRQSSSSLANDHSDSVHQTSAVVRGRPSSPFGSLEPEPLSASATTNSYLANRATAAAASGATTTLLSDSSSSSRTAVQEDILRPAFFRSESDSNSDAAGGSGCGGALEFILTANRIQVRR